MAGLPHPSIMEYLDTLNLRGDERVKVHLAAELTGSIDYPKRGDFYNFSIPVEVNGQLVSKDGFPVAQVYRASEMRSYGTKQERVQEIRNLLREEKWYPLERILEPFLYWHIPLGLEPRLSSDSVLYVFSGLMDFATELSAVVDHVALAGRELEEDFLSRLHSLTSGTFKGYCIQTRRDLDLLREAERQMKVI